MLTAAHTLDDAPESVRITTLSGRRCRATVRTQGRGRGKSGPDWALLDLDRSGSEGLPAVELGRAEVSELVFLLAYPDPCGVDGRGRIVRGDGFESAYLAPRVTFARVESLTPLVLVPVAGAVPLGGASGGGIFDREGGLVGIVSGVPWEPRRDTRHLPHRRLRRPAHRLTADAGARPLAGHPPGRSPAERRPGPHSWRVRRKSPYAAPANGMETSPRRPVP